MPAQIAPAADAKPAPEPASHDGIAWDERPTTAPTEVELVTVIKRWEVVSGQHEVLKLSGLLEMYWTDPRLAGYPLKRGLPEAIWRPEIIACQGFKMDQAEKYAVLPKFYNKEGGDASDGRLQLVVEFSFGKRPRGIQAVQGVMGTTSRRWCGRLELISTQARPAGTSPTTSSACGSSPSTRRASTSPSYFREGGARRCWIWKSSRCSRGRTPRTE